MDPLLQRLKQEGEQLTDLARTLRAWSGGQNVESTYLTRRSGSYLVLVVGTSTRYDDELEEAATALDIAIANNSAFSLLFVDVLVVPLTSFEAGSTFLDADFTIECNNQGD